MFPKKNLDLSNPVLFDPTVTVLVEMLLPEEETVVVEETATSDETLYEELNRHPNDIEGSFVLSSHQKTPNDPSSLSIDPATMEAIPAVTLISILTLSVTLIWT